MFYEQTGFDIRFDWGAHGIEALSPRSDVSIIVDVLSFSTCVDIAVGNHATILPYQWRDASAQEFAQRHDAYLAGNRDVSGYSLSPASLQNMPMGTRLVLPSPNGSALTLRAQHNSRHVLAGCLRNADAVANYVTTLGRTVAVIAAGERWQDDDSLRPALEDWLGAGALIAALPGSRSPEAAAAEAGFMALKQNIRTVLMECASGRQLHERGFSKDVTLAAQFNCSDAVPVLHGEAYVNAAASLDDDH